MIYANQQYNADKIKFFKKKLKEIDVEVIMQLGAILKEKKIKEFVQYQVYQQV